MMIHSPVSTSALAVAAPAGWPSWRRLSRSLFAANVTAQAPAAPGDAAPERSAEELEKLVGRIALYPDDLVAIILPAATNPLQMVQADRFLDKRKADPKLPLDEKWDDAVKSLLNYPEVVKSMSADLDWTADLGEAVVEDQGAVLEAIQVFRRKTQAAGNLKTDDKQTVVVEKEVIKIVPADPQVIYVPQYNPSTVVVSGGYPSWGYYPAPYPVYYYPYPPGAALATGLIWGAAIGAAWSGGRYGANYGGGATTTSTSINSTNINTGRAARRASGPRAGAPVVQPMEIQQEAGPGQQHGGQDPVVARVGDARGGAGAGAGGARPSTQPAGGGRDGVTSGAERVRRRSRPVVAPSAARTLRAARRRWTVRAALRAVARCPAQGRGSGRRPRCRAEAAVASAARGGGGGGGARGGGGGGGRGGGGGGRR